MYSRSSRAPQFPCVSEIKETKKTAREESKALQKKATSLNNILFIQKCLGTQFTCLFLKYNSYDFNINC